MEEEIKTVRGRGHIAYVEKKHYSGQEVIIVLLRLEAHALTYFFHCGSPT